MNVHGAVRHLHLPWATAYGLWSSKYGRFLAGPIIYGARKSHPNPSIIFSIILNSDRQANKQTRPIAQQLDYVVEGKKTNDPCLINVVVDEGQFGVWRTGGSSVAPVDREKLVHFRAVSVDVGTCLR